jgi:hypothetical protein
MNNYVRCFMGVCFVSLIFSCKKFVDISTPEDRVMANRVFTDDNKATSAITAIYGNMINGSSSFANFYTTLYGGMSSDELQKFNASAYDKEFMDNTLSSTNATVSAIWKTAYQSIYYANAGIKGLENSTGVAATTKMQLIGECRFIRALCYFYLVNFYGDVPLVATTDYRVNSSLPRSSVNDIYELIKTDLTMAKENLPASYLTSEKIRPNKWVATALLARVYLYNKEWEKAELEATEVINSGLYTPLLPLTNTFLKNSKEAIWQLIPNSGVLKETQQIRPSGSVLTPQIILTTSLLQSFEKGDERRFKWIDSITYAGNKYYYPAKYKNTTTTVTEYYTVLRLGEQYLIRAEAKANQSKLAEAVSDLNIIRNRAGLSSLSSTLSQLQILSAVEQERKVELFAEWGHRWFDLKRTDRANNVLGILKNNWSSTNILYPIPIEDILSNSNLKQNAGY